MGKLIDLVGQRFGRLVVLQRAEAGRGSVTWRCRCDCGTDAEITTAGLRHWNTSSCGCLQRERASEARRTHGQSKSPTYRAWKAMRARCFSPSNKDYAQYGGRGITVCENWRDNFSQFLADMGEQPPGMTVERKDPNGPYSPDNCLWATRLQQARNRRSSRLVEVNGRRMCLSEACQRFGQPRTRIRDRLANGWSLMDALQTPSLGVGRKRNRAA